MGEIIRFNIRGGTVMNFGQALELLKQGKCVARQGWNGKGMFVYYVPKNAIEQIHSAVMQEKILTEHNPYFAIVNVNSTVSTWVPSINDCLAEDWVVVE